MSLLFGTCIGAGAGQAGDDGNHLTAINDFGTPGLLQTPTARVGRDGDMFMGLSYVYPYYRYALTVQGLPWLTGTFRYTQITNRLYGPRSFSGDQSYKDRSVDVALRLFEEDEFIPETVVGLRDIGGNDLFGARVYCRQQAILRLGLLAGARLGATWNPWALDQSLGYDQ